MKANQWTLEVCKAQVLLFPEEQGARWQSAGCPGIHKAAKSEVWGALPGETIEPCLCQGSREAEERAHKRGRKRPRRQVLQIWAGGPPFPLVRCFHIAARKEFWVGKGRALLVYARHFTYAFPFHPARSSMRGRRLTLHKYLTNVPGTVHEHH